MSQNSWRKSLRTATARWSCDAQVHLNDAIRARAPKAEQVDAPHLDPAIAALLGIDGDNVTLVDVTITAPTDTLATPTHLAPTDSPPTPQPGDQV
jgi:hypothetical protein